MKTDINTVIKHWLLGVLSALYLGLPAVSWSAELAISNVPLYLGGSVEPNIMFTMDDSGSMNWSFMPDELTFQHGVKRGLAANYNRIAYDPNVDYAAPVNATGTPMTNASFTAAWNDGYEKFTTGKSTCNLDLSKDYRPTWGAVGSEADNCDSKAGLSADYGYEYWTADATTGEAAYYYVYYANHPAGAKPAPTDCTAGDENDDDCYIKVVVGSTGPGGADERQNFANWYSYYRKRIYVARVGVGRAFAQQGGYIRVGYGVLSGTSMDIDGVSTKVIRRGVRSFTGSDRTKFFELLYSKIAEGYTPLRLAADAVGQYFKRKDKQGPWNDTPAVADSGADLSCRPAYHILMSDGYWSEGADHEAATAAAKLNVDGTDTPALTHTSTLGTTFTYDAVTPFTDGHANTLADVAMYYWKNDLRDDLDNNVAPNVFDPAFWQHLVTYAVGLGVEGSISPTTAFNAISDGTTITWPEPTSSNSAKIDDMLHAAVNSRGGFFSASNPTEFAEALVKTLSNITDRTSSAASVVLNSNTLFSDSRLYQAIFRSDDWSGDLRAYSIDEDTGELTLLTAYSPAGSLPAAGSRRILSHNGTGGVPFRWNATPTADTLTAAQQTAIGSEAILNYLRGDQSNEKPSGTLRPRTSLLGDIVNSAPAFVNPPNAPYFDNWGASAPENTAPYSAFRAANIARAPFIAVGANDGMLHVFDADSGNELYAYVPSMLMDKLAALSVDGYDHTYYVDGAPTVVDAFYGGAWHTVLTGGLSAGGQGIYALDVTTLPGSTDEAALAASKVLWEFSDANDVDMGYTYSQPNIVRLANGKWAAIFGNGYNNTKADGRASTTGTAVLYVVDIETGALIKKLDTKEGSSKDPLGLNRPNGLSIAAPVDVDGDFIVDYVYAGDLFGNLWKFDLSDTNPTKWKIPYGPVSKPTPLFRARGDATPPKTDPLTAQAITTRPQIIRHPDGKGGLLVLFGTGKYFEVGDNSAVDQTTQSFYGVWDRSSASFTEFTRDHLLEQKILFEVDVAASATIAEGASYRITSDDTMVWHDGAGLPSAGAYLGWYMDLYNQEGGATSNYGERTVSDPIVRGDRVIFTTLIPSPYPCESGGSGWLMELRYANGGRPAEAPFDVNGDGKFDVDDLLDPDGTGTRYTDTTTSGRKSKVGMVPTPAILSRPGSGGGGGGQLEHKYESGSTGEVEKINENPGEGDFGRQSWRQLVK